MVNALFSFSMKLYYFLHLLEVNLYFSLTHNKNVSLTGAKSITKAMKKVASGPQRDEGTKWFSELSDKGSSITFIFVLFLRYDIYNFIINSKLLILIRVQFLLISPF